MYAVKRGLGDALNPTAGTSLDCGLLAGGVFKEACWCLQWPSLCSSDDYKAAYALAHPEVYAPIGQPPAVPAVDAAYGTVAAPYTEDEYQAAVDAAIAGQDVAAKAQNQATMNQTAANLDAVTPPDCTLFGIACWQVGLVAAILGGVVVMSMRRR